MADLRHIRHGTVLGRCLLTQGRGCLRVPSGSGQGLAKRRGGGARIRRRRLTDCGPPDGGSRVDCWAFAPGQVHELAKLDFGTAEMLRPLFGDEIEFVSGRSRPVADAGAHKDRISAYASTGRSCIRNEKDRKDFNASPRVCTNRSKVARRFSLPDQSRKSGGSHHGCTRCSKHLECGGA